MSVIDRHRRWNRLAYLSTSEKVLNRALWALLVVAVMYAVVHHVVLVNVPARSTWAPALGSIFYDFAIAYAGAFTFYLLNVRLPLRRDRRNVYRHVGPLVGLIVTQSDYLITKLNEAAQITPPNRDNTWPNIQELCSKINADTVSDAGLFFGTKGIGHHNVLTLIVDNMNRTRAWITSILGFSSFLATDLIDMLAAFDVHTHYRLASEHVMIMETTGIPVKNDDLKFWAEGLFAFTQLTSQLKDYGDKYLPMKYETRPELAPPPAHRANHVAPPR
ncbi:hypothetical protein A5658_02975 [Mycobacterium sp. 1245111.1]|uniref:hypothetical protein n=1 Tax=Mycobacterium sp. 1245111.1 TaxID=1834073 RepID=UPI0007FD903A|nr:hypothetical protein [Mycobacterium sp. 1245111.1]OBK39824.1 hypothetical protein A5658_02975 [Mycobacterium sp. 1245111.1]